MVNYYGGVTNLHLATPPKNKKHKFPFLRGWFIKQFEYPDYLICSKRAVKKRSCLGS